MLRVRCIAVVTLVSFFSLSSCDKKDEAPQPDPAAGKTEAPVPSEAAKADVPKEVELDPQDPPEKLARIMKVKDGLRGVAPFEKYRQKIAELLGEPTRKGEMYDQPLHEWAAHEGNLCVHYKQIQEDPKAKVWTGWDPGMLVKPKDDSDMLASRDWQDCLDEAAGKPKQ